MDVQNTALIGYARGTGGVPVAACLLPAVTIIASAGGVIAVGVTPAMQVAPRVFLACLVVSPLILGLRAGFRSRLHGWRYVLSAMLVICGAISAVFACFVILVVGESRITGPT